MNLVYLFHTLRFLKPVQIFGRVWFSLNRPKLNSVQLPPVRTPIPKWKSPPLRPEILKNAKEAIFLNRKEDISSLTIWHNNELDKLWVYNLHYFDDLNALNRERKIRLHYSLIRRWINENSSRDGIGWKPYPLSLRICNWIKYALSGFELTAEAKNSLATQIRYQNQRIEYHLQGNHLLANAKALVMAGLFFQNAEADAWLKKGLSIYNKQIPLQILSDGGHFELSPMYHSIILEDFLDIINIGAVYETELPEKINKNIRGFIKHVKKMLAWLEAMIHPDREISLFNDAAHGIALAPDQLFEYASLLGIKTEGKKNRVIDLKSSGYFRIEMGKTASILDASLIGPDYLPAHAHADTLTFELSYNRNRVLVNTGTSCYGLSHERLNQRKTKAHNCVVINQRDSSEVWSGFRVARRAKIISRKYRKTAHSFDIEAVHDGYQKIYGWGNIRRKWVFRENSLTVLDSMDGNFLLPGIIIFHFHPEVSIKQNGLKESFFIFLKQKIGTLTIDNKLEPKILKGVYCSQFGAQQENFQIELHGMMGKGEEFVNEFKWN